MLDTFIREHSDPHGLRFANWITEKFGAGQPWTEERATRSVCPFHAHGHTLQTPHDRSSAHFAAWHSPKRDPEVFGVHFKLDECRIWMRLHFWAMRETGVVEASPTFANYYVKVTYPFRDELRSTLHREFVECCEQQPAIPRSSWGISSPYTNEPPRSLLENRSAGARTLQRSSDIWQVGIR